MPPSATNAEQNEFRAIVSIQSVINYMMSNVKIICYLYFFFQKSNSTHIDKESNLLVICDEDALDLCHAAEY